MVIPIVSILVGLVVIALLVWAVRTLLPMAGVPTKIVHVIVIIIAVLAVLWLVGELGLFGHGTLRIG